MLVRGEDKVALENQKHGNSLHQGEVWTKQHLSPHLILLLSLALYFSVQVAEADVLGGF